MSPLRNPGALKQGDRGGTAGRCVELETLGITGGGTRIKPVPPVVRRQERDPLRFRPPAAASCHAAPGRVRCRAVPGCAAGVHSFIPRIDVAYRAGTPPAHRTFIFRRKALPTGPFQSIADLSRRFPDPRCPIAATGCRKLDFSGFVPISAPAGAGPPLARLAWSRRRRRYIDRRNTLWPKKN
jgi:hypothetical protein